MKKIILLISLVFIIGGCFDYRELNDLDIVSGIGVDYKDDEYIVNLVLVKGSNDGGSTEVENKVITGKDKNLTKAFEKAINLSSKKVYLEHVEMLLLSSDLCKKGINEIFDYIIRDININNNYFVLVSDDIDKILNLKIENEDISQLIVDTIDSYYENTSIDDIDILAGDILNKRKDIVLPLIELDNDNILFREIAYFKGDKLNNRIDNKMYLFLESDTKNISFTNEGNTIEIYNKNIKYDVKDDEILINVNGYGKIKEINNKINLEDVSSYKEIEKLVNDTINKDIINFLDSSIDNDSDILGLKDIYYKKKRKDIDNIKYKVKVNIVVNKNGTIYGRIND